MAQLILEKCESGHSIFLVGNGGSAATATHFATDINQSSRFEEGIYFRAISLADNVPMITALANDREYIEVFTGQMQNLFRKDDMLIAISASGNSPNIVEAVQLAKKLGGVSVALVGFNGGKLAQICDYVIHVSTEKGEYGPVEDIHLILDHMITSYLGMKLRNKRDAP